MLNTNELPWIPVREGLSFKPVRFFSDDRGWMLLLRVEPGTVIARHRHTGDVHAYHLEGQRMLIDTGGVLGPGSYLYEPSGNVDSWKAVGDQPLIAYITVNGAVEYLDDRDQVTSRATCNGQIERYRRHCEERGIQMFDLMER